MIGLILAGGENRRLPFNKCLMEIEGISLFKGIADTFDKVLGKTVISTNQPEVMFRFGKVLIGDLLPERGPMTGIFSAMVCMDSDSFFVTACDMPFPNEQLIRYMVASEWEGDALVPIFQGEPQPLFAVYKRRLIERLYAKITMGNKGMKRFLSETDTFFIEEGTVREHDPHGSSFVNINTLEDFRKIKGGT